MHVHVEHWWRPIKPAYHLAAIYLALVSLLTRRPPKDG